MGIGDGSSSVACMDSVLPKDFANLCGIYRTLLTSSMISMVFIIKLLAKKNFNPFVRG